MEWKGGGRRRKIQDLRALNMGNTECENVAFYHFPPQFPGKCFTVSDFFVRVYKSYTIPTDPNEHENGNRTGRWIQSHVNNSADDFNLCFEHKTSEQKYFLLFLFAGFYESFVPSHFAALKYYSLFHHHSQRYTKH